MLVLIENEKDSFNNDLSPPDSPVPYLSRNKPDYMKTNPISNTTPSPFIRPPLAPTTGITSSLPSTIPTTGITSNLNTTTDDNKGI